MNQQSAWRVEFARRYTEPYREQDTEHARRVWSPPAEPSEEPPW